MKIWLFFKIDGFKIPRCARDREDILDILFLISFFFP